MMMNYRGRLAATLAIIAGAAVAPIRSMVGGIPFVGRFAARKPVQAFKPRPGIDPTIIRQMQLQAGIKPGMDRSRRRILARQFAKKLTAAAIHAGATKGLRRSEIRRREKLIATMVGGKLVKA